MYSGTLLSRGPKDLEGAITGMRRPCWRLDPILKHWYQLTDDKNVAKCVIEKLDDLRKQWEKFVKAPEFDGATGNRIIEELRPLIEAMLHRSTVRSRMPNGARIVSTPLNIRVDVRIAVNKETRNFYTKIT